MPQPLETITQIAYVVDDLETAARRWTALAGAGPFFVLEHLQLINPCYRGVSTDIDASISLGYSGSMCVELIQQHDDSPSVFRELIQRSGGGFHHWAIMTEDFDARLDGYHRSRHAVAFSGAVAVGGRFAYVDTTDDLGGMLELIEVTPAVRRLFDSIESAARNWDHKDPIRRF